MSIVINLCEYLNDFINRTKYNHTNLLGRKFFTYTKNSNTDEYNYNNKDIPEENFLVYTTRC